MKTISPQATARCLAFLLAGSLIAWPSQAQTLVAEGVSSTSGHAVAAQNGTAYHFWTVDSDPDLRRNGALAVGDLQFDPPSGGPFLGPRIAADGRGSLWLAWGEADPDDEGGRAASATSLWVSRFDGASWGPAREIFRTEAPGIVYWDDITGSVSVDPNGHLHVSAATFGAGPDRLVHAMVDRSSVRPTTVLPGRAGTYVTSAVVDDTVHIAFVAADDQVGANNNSIFLTSFAVGAPLHEGSEVVEASKVPFVTSPFLAGGPGGLQLFWGEAETSGYPTTLRWLSPSDDSGGWTTIRSYDPPTTAFGLQATRSGRGDWAIAYHTLEDVPPAHLLLTTGSGVEELDAFPGIPLFNPRVAWDGDCIVLQGFQPLPREPRANLVWGLVPAGRVCTRR